jgi:hypothetical protein
MFYLLGYPDSLIQLRTISHLPTSALRTVVDLRSNEAEYLNVKNFGGLFEPFKF